MPQDRLVENLAPSYAAIGGRIRASQGHMEYGYDECLSLLSGPTQGSYKKFISFGLFESFLLSDRLTVVCFRPSGELSYASPDASASMSEWSLTKTGPYMTAVSSTIGGVEGMTVPNTATVLLATARVVSNDGSPKAVPPLFQGDRLCQLYAVIACGLPTPMDASMLSAALGKGSSILSQPMIEHIARV